MEYLFFVGIAILIAFFIWGYRKFKIANNEASLGKLIISIIDIINIKLPSWKYSKELSTVCQYAIMALNIIQETQDITDIIELRKYVMLEAEDICKINNIKIDADFTMLLGAIVDALIAKEVAQ